MRLTRRRSAIARSTLLAGLAFALLAGCSAAPQKTSGHGSPGRASTSGSSGGGSSVSATPTPRRSDARITVSPAPSARGVGPRTPVVVSAADGKLRSVTVTDPHGRPIGGKTDSTGTRWRSVATLGYATTYRVSAVAADSAGVAAHARTSFATVRPKAQVFTPISPLSGTTVGVGYPVVVYFDHTVANTGEAEKHLLVSTSPHQTGAWHWFGNGREAHWRPAVYWRAGSRVAVAANLFGVDLGNGIWGKGDRQIHFAVGPRHVSVANSITHRMAVFDGSKLVENFPVSMGREVKGRWTRSGVHVVNAKNLVKHMDSTTFGLALDAGGYRATVKFATRISNNGEFVHSAPWSVAQQGKSNASHGCINLNPKRAAWFFKFSNVGDVVQVVGTPVPLTPADGDIYDWTIPWNQW